MTKKKKKMLPKIRVWYEVADDMDAAKILHWHGWPIPPKGPSTIISPKNKIGVVAWLLNFCFHENRITKKFMLTLIQKAIDYKVLLREDLNEIINCEEVK